MPDNKVLFLDFETYYSSATNYSLRKMSIPSYILDHRYETIIVAAKELGQKGQIIDGPDFPEFLAQYPPETTTTVTFNSLFDNAILAWRYSYVPNTMIDVMGMARSLLGHELTSFSLNSVGGYLGVGSKTGALAKVDGMTRAQIKATGTVSGYKPLWDEFCEYALQDNEIAEGAFLRLYPRMPWSERRLMDMVLRCCVQPRFVCDVPMLEAHLIQVKADKEALLASCGVDSTTLLSTAKFRKELEALGVPIQMKVTATGNETPAFAKSDKFMEELSEHTDPRVQALAAARLGVKSTIEETRTEKLLGIAKLPWQTLPDGSPRLYSGGTMPVPLRFGGAHTHRLSGDWGMNLQNLPSMRGSKGKSKLRLSLKAPPGHTVVVADLGQIEARLVAFVCGCTKLVDQFAKKLDPYSMLASTIFGRPINRKLAGTPDEVMGFIGKTGILGLGFGAGKDKFDGMVLSSARAMGIDLSLIGYDRATGDRAVDSYRRDYHQIPASWNTLQHILETVWLHGGSVKFGPVVIERGSVLMPNGMRLEYADPHQKQVKLEVDYNGVPRISWRNELFYRYGKMVHKIYGAKFLENIIQALARIIVMNAALRIRDRGKYRPCPHAYFFAMQAHDELVYLVPNEELAHAKKIIHEEMTRPPSWGRALPLTADIGEGASYGAAK